MNIHSSKPLKLSVYNPDFSQQASSNVKILPWDCTSGSLLSEPAGTINEVLVLLMNPTAEPHTVQKYLAEQKYLENSLEG